MCQDFLTKGHNFYGKFLKWYFGKKGIKKQFYKQYNPKYWVLVHNESRFKFLDEDFRINNIICFDKKNNQCFVFFIGTINDGFNVRKLQVMKIILHFTSFIKEIELHIGLLSKSINVLKELKIINNQTKLFTAGNCTNAALSAIFVSQYCYDFPNLRNITVSLWCPPKILMRRKWMKDISKLPINLHIFNLIGDKWASNYMRDKTTYLKSSDNWGSNSLYDRLFVGTHDFRNYNITISRFLRGLIK